MTIKRHMSLNIKGMLEYYGKRKIKDLFFKEDGTPLSSVESREYLNECLSNGWRVIPIGECDNFDYQKGCLGHTINN